MDVEMCQDNFFLHILPGVIFQNLMTALRSQPSPQFYILLLFYHFIKQDLEHSSSYFGRNLPGYVFNVHADKIFCKDSTKAFCVWFSFLIIGLLTT